MDTNDELASYLDALARDDCYRVDAVLKDGAILECGTHRELMAKGGYYCELYRAQFDTVENGTG